MKPTAELYNSLQLAFDHFNAELFDGELPQVLFTNQRQHGVMGYFAPNRWASNDGQQCHEIAINPLYVGKATLIELMQTLVHEMVHCWQQCHGKPSRSGYHNKQWSNKMIEIGLMPSDTGKVGGALVGQHMGDYPAKSGKFIDGCQSLLKEKSFNLPWVDRFAFVQSRNTVVSNESIEALIDVDDDLVKLLTSRLENVFGEDSFVISGDIKKNTKSKYNCTGCNINVWGRPKLQIKCENCDLVLIEC